MNIQFGYTIIVNSVCRFIPNEPTTKESKRPRKGKATLTAQRMEYRNRFWNPLRNRLRAHLNQKKGNQLRMAQALGMQSSQLHRYTCPVCEHDQEPTYSVACAILLYLNTHNS